MACLALISDHERNTSNTMSERYAQHSHLTMIGINPVMLEMPNTYIHQHDRTHLLSSVKISSTYNHQHDRTHILSSLKRHITYNHHHGRTHLLPSMKRPCSYNHQCDRTHLLSSVERPNSYIHQHDRENLLSYMERPCTYNWSCGSQYHIHIRMDPHLHMIMWEPIPQSYQNGSALTSDHVRANPITMSEGLMDSSLPLGRNLNLENTKLLPKVLELQSDHV